MSVFAGFRGATRGGFYQIQKHSRCRTVYDKYSTVLEKIADEYTGYTLFWSRTRSGLACWLPYDPPAGKDDAGIKRRIVTVFLVNKADYWSKNPGEIRQSQWPFAVRGEPGRDAGIPHALLIDAGRVLGESRRSGVGGEGVDNYGNVY